MAKNFLGALRAQSEGQGNLSMHPQGDNLYGYGPTTHFLAYFRLVLGATNTPPAPRFRPVLGLAAPAAPFGSLAAFRDLGSPEPQNLPRQVIGFLADRPPRRPTFRPRGTVGSKHEAERRSVEGDATFSSFLATLCILPTHTHPLPTALTRYIRLYIHKAVCTHKAVHT